MNTIPHTVTERKVGTFRDTVRTMQELALKHIKDVEPFRSMSLLEFYLHLRALPYREDGFDAKTGEPIEKVARPGLILNPRWTGNRDCDDKATAMHAFCLMQGIPSRIVVSGVSEKPHHVYSEAQIGGKWTSVDATYPHSSLLGMLPYREVFREVFP